MSERDPKPANVPITAQLLWDAHRAAFGGKGNGGATLLERLEDCPLRQQEAYWAMARAAWLASGSVGPSPLPPRHLAERFPEEATRIVGDVDAILRVAAQGLDPTPPDPG